MDKKLANKITKLEKKIEELEKKISTLIFYPVYYPVYPSNPIPQSPLNPEHPRVTY